MKVILKELKAGPALDFLIAGIFGTLPASMDDWKQRWPAYSTDWAAGGPVLSSQLSNYEKKRAGFFYCNKFGTANSHWPVGHPIWSYGDTPLEAAMRTIAIFYLGALEAEVPDELMEASA